jgi:hypothetical protein
MTYFYYYAGMSQFLEMKEPIEWSMPTAIGPLVKMEIVSITLLMPNHISEKFQWCKNHLRNFKLFKEETRPQSHRIVEARAWHFYVPDPEEAIMFKLRWNE